MILSDEFPAEESVSLEAHPKRRLAMKTKTIDIEDFAISFSLIFELWT